MDDDDAASRFTDPRDGQVYPLITIGGLTWLGRNLNYDVPGSSWHGDDPTMGPTYGRLYTLEAGRAACPPGFRLGTDEDWKDLERALGMPEADLEGKGYSVERGSDVGAQLKRGGSSGFDAVFAGYWARPRGYEAWGDRTYFWVDSEAAPGQVYRRRIGKADPTIFRFTNPAGDFRISVRCVRDAV